MARKKKQPAQDVQENTIDTSGKKADTPNANIEKAFDIAGAGFLMSRAAEYYNKPKEQATLADAFNMLQEETAADRAAGKISEEEKNDLDTKAEKMTKSTAETIGKTAENITIADIDKLTVSDAELDYMSMAIGVSQGVKEFASTVSNAVKRITDSPEYKAIADITRKTAAFLAFFSQNADKIEELTGRAKEFEAEILPYIILEVAERTGERIIFNGQAEHWTLDDIKALLATPEKPSTDKTPFEQEIDNVLDQFTFTGEPQTDYARELLKAAGARRASIDESIEVIGALTSISESLEGDSPDIAKIEKAAEELKELPRIIAQQAENLDYPLDKPNSKIWNLLTTADENGQLSFAIDTAKKGSGKEALIYYSIDFTALESLPELNITKQLTPFDKRVYIIAAALFNAGNEVITATQIYKADHDKLPSDKDLKKINDSLTKMGAAHIYIDNKQEISINKKYPKFKYDASLLPFERMSAYINGQLAEAAIHLLREPPLITFARERKQITTIDRQLLLAPVSKTDANLRIEDYLIERISHMKSPHSRAPRKLLYSTIFENCGITEKKQKQRAPEKIRRFLDYYIECELIKGYAETKEGITITL